MEARSARADRATAGASGADMDGRSGGRACSGGFIAADSWLATSSSKDRDSPDGSSRWEGAGPAVSPISFI